MLFAEEEGRGGEEVAQPIKKIEIISVKITGIEAPSV